MHSVGAFEAKTHFSALLEKVAHGERVVITRHGKPIARLVPISDVNDVSKKEAADKIKFFRKGVALATKDKQLISAATKLGIDVL